MKLIKKERDNRLLIFLYQTSIGRLFLRLLTNKKLSIIIGNFLDSEYSKFLIRIFIRNNKINTDEVKEKDFISFNDYFTRELKDNARFIDYSENTFISPCDGLLSIHKIDNNNEFKIKNTSYTTKSLLKDDELASKFKNGYCLIFRLCVNHYHRYIFNEFGKVLKTKRIDGILHTVRPIATENTKVFVENSREYTVIESNRIGEYIQMEVGAMLVGKIKNHKIENCVPGLEKGYFEYGGSTIVMLIQKDKLKFENNILGTNFLDYELEVKTGEIIAEIAAV